MSTAAVTAVMAVVWVASTTATALIAGPQLIALEVLGR